MTKSVRTVGEEAEQVDLQAQVDMLWSQLHQSDDEKQKLRAELATVKELAHLAVATNEKLEEKLVNLREAAEKSEASIRFLADWIDELLDGGNVAEDGDEYHQRMDTNVDEALEALRAVLEES